MIFSLIFTAFAVLNLTFSVVGLSLLPATVPINFGADLSVLGVGSPWAYAAFSAAAAFAAGALFPAALIKGEKLRRAVSLFLVFCASALIVLGWTFFALTFSAAREGKAVFPYALVVVLPLSLVLILGACVISLFQTGKEGRKVRLAAMCFLFAAGAVSSVFSVLFSLFWREVSYLSAVVYVLSLGASAIGFLLYFRAIKKRYHEKL